MLHYFWAFQNALWLLQNTSNTWVERKLPRMGIFFFVGPNPTAGRLTNRICNYISKPRRNSTVKKI